MSLTEKWYRNSFEVDVVRVTKQNMAEVAEWCGGTIHKDLRREIPELYIALEKTEYNKIRISRVYIGDRVLLVNGIFKNYRNEKFLKSFNRNPEKRREEVLALVMEAMVDQDRMSAIGDHFPLRGRVANEITDKIMKIFGGEQE